MNKVVFFSNYLNHHQLPLCKELVKLTNDNFYFVSQKAISEKRIALGYKNISNDYPFVVKTYESKNELDRAYSLANEADYVLFGSSNTDYIEKRIKDNKITFKYSERLFKFNKNKLGFLREIRRVYINHTKYKKYPLYMLCAGAYAAYDFNKYGAYKNKTYKWGYFPETYKYNENDLMKQKDKKTVSLLWVGRLIDWKHPEISIEIARRLSNDNIDFKLNIIGQGILCDEIKNQINKYGLNNNVVICGSMTPEEVRQHMVESNIIMFTSDSSEGWGAVLNEAMNSGCACVSSHVIGSTGFLIKNNENGLIYKDGDIDDLYNKIKMLIDNKEYRQQLGLNAYKTITELWNAEVAAERFMTLCKCLEEGKDTPYSDGPCSKALPINEEEMLNTLTNEDSRN